jgi:hypothetical protein
MFKLFQWLLGELVEVWDTIVANLRGLGDAAIEEVLDYVASAFPSLTGISSSTSTLLGQMDYFVAINEALVAGAAYMALYAFVVTYKMVKSWIPLVSGG